MGFNSAFKGLNVKQFKYGAKEAQILQAKLI
jgi:hypothetical protein